MYIAQMRILDLFTQPGAQLVPNEPQAGVHLRRGFGMRMTSLAKLYDWPCQF